MFGYFWNKELAKRKVGPACPEIPDRCRVLSPRKVFSVANGVRATGFRTRGASILLPVHRQDYITEVQKAHSWGRWALDAGETRVTPDTYEQSLLAASAGCEALEQIMTGKLTSAFCAVRPPGHHANSHRAMGFCVFNNAAVAAKCARDRYGVQSVLIVDWDVHPGNGTQEIFWRDPSVFTLSFHQADLFPESGRAEFVGEGAGRGFNRNVPLAPKTTAAQYVEKFEIVVNEVAGAFKPELLLIAAGFDAHKRDSAGKLELTEEDYTRMTEILLRATRPYTQGKTLSLLEGGYNLSALRSSVAAHCRALAAFSE